jgi:hypothetical protein
MHQLKGFNEEKNQHNMTLDSEWDGMVTERLTSHGSTQSVTYWTSVNPINEERLETI